MNWFTNDELAKLSNEAYRNACEHGFHDEKMPYTHYLMLIITEIGELVEAERINHRANLEAFEEVVLGLDPHEFPTKYQECFEGYIKDSLEDELADIAVRIFDLAGLAGLQLHVNSYLPPEFAGDRRLTEKCFCLVRFLSGARTLGSLSVVLRMLLEIADYYHVDLKSHIHWKMSYNALRPHLHGKSF